MEDRVPHREDEVYSGRNESSAFLLKHSRTERSAIARRHVMPRKCHGDRHSRLLGRVDPARGYVADPGRQLQEEPGGFYHRGSMSG